MNLNKQISQVADREQADINRLKFGEVVFVVQGGRVIRMEVLIKKKVEG